MVRYRHTCSECAKSFLSKKGLNSHQRIKHKKKNKFHFNETTKVESQICALESCVTFSCSRQKKRDMILAFELSFYFFKAKDGTVEAKVATFSAQTDLD